MTTLFAEEAKSSDRALLAFSPKPSPRSSPPLREPVQPETETGSDQAKTFKPCFSTTASSFSAIPLGRLVPASHFWTVDSLVFR